MPSEQNVELAACVPRVLAFCSQSAKGRAADRELWGLYRQALLFLLWLRQNVIQSMVADLFGRRQPSVSRFYRRLAQIIGDVLANHGPEELGDLAGKYTLLVNGNGLIKRR